MMTRRTGILAWARSLAAFCGALAGCVNFARDAAPERYYDLSVTPPKADLRRMPNTRLKVARFQISPRFSGQGLVYRVSDHQWQRDPYERFFLDPERAVEEETRRWMTATGPFETVLLPGSIIEATHRLEVLVSELFCDYREVEKPAAVLGMQVFVLEERALGPEKAFHGDYRARMVLKARARPADIVAGFEKALGEVLTKLGKDLGDRLPEWEVARDEEASPAPNEP